MKLLLSDLSEESEVKTKPRPGSFPTVPPIGSTIIIINQITKVSTS